LIKRRCAGHAPVAVDHAAAAGEASHVTFECFDAQHAHREN